MVNESYGSNKENERSGFLGATLFALGAAAIVASVPPSIPYGVNHSGIRFAYVALIPPRGISRKPENSYMVRMERTDGGTCKVYGLNQELELNSTAKIKGNCPNNSQLEAILRDKEVIFLNFWLNGI